VLTGLLRDAPEPEVRAGAAQGLVRLADRRALPAALAALADDDPSVRAWALEAIHAVVTTRFSFDPQKAPSLHAWERNNIEKYLRDHEMLP
jgi:HEAT repeat protein